MDTFISYHPVIGFSTFLHASVIVNLWKGKEGSLMDVEWRNIVKIGGSSIYSKGEWLKDYLFHYQSNSKLMLIWCVSSTN